MDQMLALERGGAAEGRKDEENRERDPVGDRRSTS